MPQDGKIKDPAAPPFATSSGKSTTIETTAPTDLIAKGKSDVAEGGDRDFIRESRTQPTEQGQPPTPPWLANRSQQAGSPASRVNPKSIPQGGVIPPTTSQQPKGTGSIGNGAKPFKGMK